MITVQVVEHPKAKLFQTLKTEMRNGGFKTLYLEKWGRKIKHRNAPGWINWQASKGVIQCEALSPQKPGHEWQMAHAFVGRLMDRFADKIISINIQFPDSQ